MCAAACDDDRRVGRIPVLGDIDEQESRLDRVVHLRDQLRFRSHVRRGRRELVAGLRHATHGPAEFVEEDAVLALRHACETIDLIRAVSGVAGVHRVAHRVPDLHLHAMRRVVTAAMEEGVLHVVLLVRRVPALHVRVVAARRIGVRLLLSRHWHRELQRIREVLDRRIRCLPFVARPRHHAVESLAEEVVGDPLIRRRGVARVEVGVEEADVREVRRPRGPLHVERYGSASRRCRRCCRRRGARRRRRGRRRCRSADRRWRRRRRWCKRRRMRWRRRARDLHGLLASRRSGGHTHTRRRERCAQARRNPRDAQAARDDVAVAIHACHRLVIARPRDRHRRFVHRHRHDCAHGHRVAHRQRDGGGPVRHLERRLRVAATTRNASDEHQPRGSAPRFRTHGSHHCALLRSRAVGRQSFCVGAVGFTRTLFAGIPTYT